jgi:hypothetical protein
MAVMTELETNPKQTPFFFLTDHNHVVRIPIRLLSKVKSSRETETLRARLPAQLAQFASNISIIEPIQTIRISHTDGVHCCSCGSEERRTCMSVAVVPSPHSQSQDSEEPRTKPFEFVWQDWSTGSSYLIGSMSSQKCSISIKYGPPRDGMHSKAETFMACTTTAVGQMILHTLMVASDLLWKK